MVHGRDPPTNPKAAAAIAAAAALRRTTSEHEEDVTFRAPTVTDGVTLYTANLGDCRAILCRGGAAVRLSEDHKPNSREEKGRVERAGGCVINCNGIWRVCTSASAARLVLVADDSLFLSTSRAIGDRKLKPHGVMLVSPVPEVTACTLQWDDLFFVLACDGVWDVLSDQAVVDLVAEKLAFNESPKTAAAAVVRAAFNAGSLDNVTATVVQFGWHTCAAVEAAMKSRKAKLKAEKKAMESKIAEEEIDMFA